MNILEAPSDKLLAGIRTLLAVKGIATADEVAERIRITDSASPARGAAMVAPRMRSLPGTVSTRTNPSPAASAMARSRSARS